MFKKKQIKFVKELHDFIKITYKFSLKNNMNFYYKIGC